MNPEQLFGDYLHPRLITAMLCFCDFLDMDTDRFDETMLNAISDLPKLFREHKQKHESLTPFSMIIILWADVCRNLKELLLK